MKGNVMKFKVTHTCLTMYLSHLFHLSYHVPVSTCVPVSPVDLSHLWTCLTFVSDSCVCTRTHTDWTLHLFLLFYLHALRFLILVFLISLFFCFSVSVSLRSDSGVCYMEKASRPATLGFPWVQLPPEYRGSGLRNKVRRKWRSYWQGERQWIILPRKILK